MAAQGHFTDGFLHPASGRNDNTYRCACNMGACSNSGARTVVFAILSEFAKFEVALDRAR